MGKPIVAISVGDLNGIGFEIALDSHEEVKKLCRPVYFISKNTAKKCAELLNKNLPEDFECFEVKDDFKITAGKISKRAGSASFESFMSALKHTASGKSDAIVTLPISKEAWKKANVKFVGHTDVLRDYFKQNAIMALGCKRMMVALFTDHIRLKEISKKIKTKKIFEFLKLLKTTTNLKKAAVLGLNPHAGDGGALGNEEAKIVKAAKAANKFFGEDIFDAPMVADAVFNPLNRDKYEWFVAMYHDQGLAPLKALYFEESINVSLGLPIVRTSVDHGTAFDIAYKNAKPSNKSYLNAVRYAIMLVQTNG